MDRHKRKRQLRQKRQRHIRKKLEGTPEQPRLCVYRSNKHIYAQIIDDINGHSILSASTLDQELRDKLDNTADTSAAAHVGETIGNKCIENGIQKVVFDRSGYKYHGRVKALAEAARKCFADAGAEGF